MLTDVSKTLIIVGLIFIFAGIIIFFAGKIPGFGKLPGDIFIKKDNFSFYFPITTSIIISIFLSILLFLWNKR